MSANENGLTVAANSQTAKNANRAGLQHHSSPPVEEILSRLENVRPHGKDNRCECPIGHRSKGTLSVTTGEDGQVLLHCFAGCEPLDIVHAIGLELKDLFPARITANMPPAERRQLRQAARQSQWAAALNVLSLEARIVSVAADQIAQAEPLNDSDRDRLGLALERITGARLVLNG